MEVLKGLKSMGFLERIFLNISKAQMLWNILFLKHNGIEKLHFWNEISALWGNFMWLFDQVISPLPTVMRKYGMAPPCNLIWNKM
jgi:hypothetical protein